MKTAHLASVLILAAAFCFAPLHAQFLGPSVDAPGASVAKPLSMAPDVASTTKIVPGDVIAITTLSVPELTLPSVRVEPNGNILLPFVGAIKVDGKTPTELTTELSSRLASSGILVDPQVTVQITDSPTRIISVVGEVKAPRTIPAMGSLRLLDVISACGGLTPDASHNITIRRGVDATSVTVLLGVDPQATDPANVILQPGDTVIVPRVGNVFVLGEVKNPQSFSLGGNDPITVTRALAMAGGVKYSAGLSKAKIIRRGANSQRTEIPIDIHHILTGKEPDPVLIADDVLFLPANAFKAALANQGANVAASALYGIGFIATR